MFTRYWVTLLLLAATSSLQGAAWAPSRLPNPNIARCHQRECSLLPARATQQGIPSRRNPSPACTGSPRGLPSFGRNLVVHAVGIEVNESSRIEAEASDFVNLKGVVESTPAADEEASAITATAPSFLDAPGRELPEQILNALVLSVCFGYAAYTILNIDHGMTRGWTQSEIAMRIPLDNWSTYESSLAEKPIYTKTLINVVIYLLGDWLSQTVFQKKNVLDFDAKRTMRNGFIGLCFGPLVHEYYQFSDRILPVENGLWTRIEKILMDQTLYLTIKCSVYITAVGLLQGDDWRTVRDNTKDRIGGIVITAWKFWPLIHCITYSLIPARHRILWVNSVDLIWNAILSTLARDEEPKEGDAEAVVAEGPGAIAFHVDPEAALGSVPSLVEETSLRHVKVLSETDSLHVTEDDATETLRP